MKRLWEKYRTEILVLIGVLWLACLLVVYENPKRLKRF